jgi:hypothetical protein
MKQTIVALVWIAISAWLAHWHAATQVYHPVVQLTSADGLTYTAVQASTSDRQACGAANDRVLRPLKEHCRKCEVHFARCARKLEGLEAALHEDAALPHHRILAPGIRVAIVGRAAPAKRSCELIAGDMLRRGLRSAACVYPEA